MNSYPTVFVHGYLGWGEEDAMADVLGYWGQGDGNVLAHLKREGYECFAPSLGPYTGVWDRSCELWAYLFGGRVDYGKVHSKKYGHKRFGRLYAHGALEDLGRAEGHEKMNLIGHSFGGPTVKAFADLLCYGNPEEREGTDPEDLSPLFAGGHSGLLHSVTTLSGVNNGTTFDCLPNWAIRLATYWVLAHSAAYGNIIHGFLNLGLQYYGIGTEPHGKRPGIPSLLRSLRGIRRYAANTWDTATYEMTVPMAFQMNERQKPDPHVYYFAHRANCTKVLVGPTRWPDREVTSVFCQLTSAFMGVYLAPHIRHARTGYDVNARWFPNDGFVNVIGQSAPLQAPHEEGSFGMAFRPGLWYNMPVIRGDHLWWNGIHADRGALFDYYDRILRALAELPDA